MKIFFILSTILFNLNLLAISICSFNGKENLKKNSMFEPKFIDDIKRCLQDRKFGVSEVTGFEDLAPKEAIRLYNLLAESIGILLVQNFTTNSILEKISDERRERSFSHHNQSVPFHTDGSFLKKPPQVVGMYVQKRALNGGETELVSLDDLLKNLKEKSLWRRLLSPVSTIPHNKERSEDNSDKITLTPLSPKVAYYRSDLIYKGSLLLNDIIEIQRVKDALKEVDTALEKSSNKYCFIMENGRLYFFNNEFLFHNRRNYEGERILWRTWINLK